ncbi:hypothetical protein HanPI659440_Chr00c08g0719501 [Helianthus annuus]|nr:hypothetical protein HanPI659440_Chr00c08g0719501 [Helianthus annuus]
MCLFQEKKMTLRSLLNQRPAADLGVAHGSESIAATLRRRYCSLSPVFPAPLILYVSCSAISSKTRVGLEDLGSSRIVLRVDALSPELSREELVEHCTQEHD